ncbi:uncharacterized protein EDB91DRAFT_1150079 [Suillus paluster]|uniref:uncharacterized protein n=1 Tax=Suillus paluster TaxID=48578 RepID=UPI001B86AE89|nr:uncharacterized protein EDB91DRAFT_1150079 [Suillus paluster]KAG1733044.1 hypothetical protein EDB91DRAFT_1150079 [Suillus paluster]
MSSNSTDTPTLPPSLDLPPHLSAQKYFFVCTLTVLAWDALVLTPRSYKLGRQPKWPALKAMYYFLQFWVLADFVVTGVMFFSTTVIQDTDCVRFWPYEPICTAILIAVASAVHVMRISAIYDHTQNVRATMWGLYAVQIVVTAICCGFYRSVHLEDGQGCIAGPLNNASWVGIYWLAPTLLYGTSFVLAALRSIKTLQAKKVSYWRLMLRDGLNLYGAILLVNLVNVLFYFIMTPTDPTDPIKTIVSSMAAVLTTTMSMRIILSVRGDLANGGSFSVSSHAASSSGANTHSLSGSGTRPRGVNHTFTLGDMRDASVAVAGRKEGGEWDADKSSVTPHEESKVILPIVGEDIDGGIPRARTGLGVQITVDQQVEYDDGFARK